MKLAITGKGGVGKTTLTALMANRMAGEGKRVIAVDADPDANLGSALGFENTDKIVPISRMEELIFDRTGAKPGTTGTFFKLNPKVDDLPEKLWIEQDNLRLMVMGTVKTGGGGCVCPENALLKTLVSHLVIYREDVVILDMEAGIEHMGRGTAASVDMFIVVVEPGKRSIETAHNIQKLAGDLGITKISVVGSKVRSKEDEIFITENVKGIKVLGFIPYDEKFINSDMKGEKVSVSFSENVDAIIKNIEGFSAG